MAGYKYGDIRETSGCGLCGPAITGYTSCTGEFGQEWAYDSPGSCGSCSFGFLNLPGTHARCRKVGYNGDTLACCLGDKPPGYPMNTCNPAFTYDSTYCVSVMNDFCSRGNNIFTNEKCRAWAELQKDRAQAIKKNYCTLPDGSLRRESGCYVFAASSEAQGTIDDVMVRYCQQNPTSDLCSCINSEMDCPNKFDRRCIQKGGYKTKDMLTATCPTVMNCSQFVNLSPGAQALATNVEQNCASLGKPTPTPPDTTPSDQSAYPMEIIIVFLFILMLILLAAMGVVYTWPKKHGVTVQKI